MLRTLRRGFALVAALSLALSTPALAKNPPLTTAPPTVSSTAATPDIWTAPRRT